MLFSQYHLVRIANNNFISISYHKFLFNLITSFKFNWCVLLLRKTISRQRNPLIVFAGWCKCRYTVSADLYWNKTLPKPTERTTETVSQLRPLGVHKLFGILWGSTNPIFRLFFFFKEFSELLWIYSILGDPVFWPWGIAFMRFPPN